MESMDFQMILHLVKYSSFLSKSKYDFEQTQSKENFSSSRHDNANLVYINYLAFETRLTTIYQLSNSDEESSVLVFMN